VKTINVNCFQIGEFTAGKSRLVDRIRKIPTELYSVLLLTLFFSLK